MCKKITLREINLLREYFIKTQQFFRDEALRNDRRRKLISMNDYYKRELQRKIKTGI